MLAPCARGPRSPSVLSFIFRRSLRGAGLPQAVGRREPRQAGGVRRVRPLRHALSLTIFTEYSVEQSQLETFVFTLGPA